MTGTRHNSRKHSDKQAGQEMESIKEALYIDIEGDSEVQGTVRNPRKTDWDSYIRHLSNNKFH